MIQETLWHMPIHIQRVTHSDRGKKMAYVQFSDSLKTKITSTFSPHREKGFTKPIERWKKQTRGI